jgi:hypothetical protein
MNKRTLMIAALALVACEEATPEEIAEQVLHDAGQILQDAGQALADASVALSDSGTASAQQDSGAQPVSKVLESSCDQVRSATGGQYGTSSNVQHFARFSAALEDVRSAWLCDSPDRSPLDCPSGDGVTCSGAQPPKMRCTTASVMEGTDGSLWLLCGSAPTARLVLD